MANAAKLILSFFLQSFLLLLFAIELVTSHGLKLGFYSTRCPSAEKIVKQITKQYISRAPSLAAPLLRMHFHDCFVRGCDGSVLLNSTRTNQAEKDAFPNLSLRGFHVIDAVKTAIEKRCPGVVSCADILTLVARDAVFEINGPFWAVPTGRRDGRVSMASEVFNNLPAPTFNVSQLKASFASKGLSVKDLAVLSGGHTIGIAHCPTFANRLYNFTGKGDTDPTLDRNYIARLKLKCKPGDTTTTVEMVPRSSKRFDADYYNVVGKRRGATKAYVQLQASPTGGSSTFLKDFADSMVRLGQIGILTGRSGEIRKQCTRIN